MHKKHLLYITNGVSGSGGLERVLAIKTDYLTKHFNYQISIITLNEFNQTNFFDFNPNVKIQSITAYGNPVKYIYQYIKNIIQKVKQLKPDLICVCDDGLKGFFVPIILAKKYPIFYERHVSKIIELGENPNFIKKIMTNIKFWLMNQLGKTFDKFVVLTPDNKKEWQLNNLLVIPNPLSFYPEESSSLSFKTVIAVGKQSYQKGYDRLLQAWQLVNQKHPDWQLNIYGTMHPQKIFDKLAERLQIQNTVHFFPATKNIQAKYLESSIYVLSSRFEGFGMVLIEAMACGVPCIAFDCPYGPANIVRHQQDGLIVKNGDIKALADSLLDLISNQQKLITLGKNAKENAQNYLPQNVMQQWIQLFNQFC